MTPDDLLYSKDHEWTRVENGTAVIGITDYAQDALGDVVYVDIPEVDAEVIANDVVGEIESVKSTSELHTPISGTIVEINQKAIDTPEIINTDPYGEGWLFKVEISDKAELEGLMSAQDYDEYTKEL